jgi:hypothetical protein
VERRAQTERNAGQQRTRRAPDPERRCTVQSGAQLRAGAAQGALENARAEEELSPRWGAVVT